LREFKLKRELTWSCFSYSYFKHHLFLYIDTQKIRKQKIPLSKVNQKEPWGWDRWWFF